MLHSTVELGKVSAWKQEGQEALRNAFSMKRGRKAAKAQGIEEAALFEQIGRLQMELA